MAQACPSLILDAVLKQLESPIFQSNSHFNIQFQDTRSKLKLMSDVMDEAEPMGILFPDIVGEWLCRLQTLLYEVHDLLDEAITLSMTSSNTVDKVRLYLYGLPFYLTVAPKMTTFNKRLDSIVDDCYKCNLIVVNPGSQKPIARKGILRYDPDYVKDDKFPMFGLHDKKRRAISMLNSMGMGCIIGDIGRGKSTVCRAVYNDENVSRRFELRLWIGLGGGVSDRLFIELWKNAITEAGLEVEEARPYLEAENKGQVMHHMVSLLAAKGTLLVLDDIPRHNLEGNFCLDDVYKLFHLRGHADKSWVLMSSIYYPEDFIPGIRLLSTGKKNARFIFKNTASIPGPGRCSTAWKISLGKKIASNCGGSPSLIRGIGTLLYGNNDRETWQNFARNPDRLKRRFDVYSGIRGIMYDTFPKVHQSFGYLSLFSYDKFKFQTIVQQLTTHGFADLSNAQRMPDALFSRVTSIEDWDALGAYKVSWKDGAQLLGGVESTILRLDDNTFHETARHICVARPSSSTDEPKQNRILPDCLIKNAAYRRTLLFLGTSCPMLMSAQTLDTLASNLRYLRVLDLQDLGLQALPNSVGMLIHLKYLDLSRNNFRVLPRSVCRLKKLETLKLVYCDKLLGLPQRIKSLGHLKHLEINMCLDITHMPSRLAKLTGLTRLDRFVVGPHSGGLKYLEKLNNLDGNLSIELPRKWKRSKIDASQARLAKKVGLTALEFKWQGAATGDGKNDDYDVLEELKPCTGIENLVIFSFGGTKLPSWISGLDRLTEITIAHCKGCEILPPLHGLPQLRSLTLTSMNMEYLQDNNHSGDDPSEESLDATGFFPSLEVLKIGRMWKLKGWWLEDVATASKKVSVFREIKTVEIWKCPCLEAMPPFSTITDRSIFHDVSSKMLQYVDWKSNRRAEVISIQGMESLPKEFVANFPETLKIKDCKQLQMLWEDNVEEREVSGSLEYLSLSNCAVGKHLSNNLRYLTNLKRLSLSKCSEDLHGVSNEAEDERPWNNLYSLVKLKIKGFERLVSPPQDILNIPSLQELDIKDCKALKYFSEILGQLTGLVSLKISKCSNELDCLYNEDNDGMPWKSLTNLDKLAIEGFDNLVCLPKGLDPLMMSELHIKDCRALKHLSRTLSKQGQLLSLTISNCSEELDCLYEEDEDGMPWKIFQLRLNSLSTLKIEGFENLVALPKGLRYLNELLLLEIVDCKNLKWEVGNLPIIRDLVIKSCPHLSKIIEELKREYDVWSE